jgi:hypothetical protein
MRGYAGNDAAPSSVTRSGRSESAPLEGKQSTQCPGQPSGRPSASNTVRTYHNLEARRCEAPSLYVAPDRVDLPPFAAFYARE